jgi:asparagine N-glycosylation enzyme membrane subunit Stt3
MGRYQRPKKQKWEKIIDGRSEAPFVVNVAGQREREAGVGFGGSGDGFAQLPLHTRRHFIQSADGLEELPVRQGDSRVRVGLVGLGWLGWCALRTAEPRLLLLVTWSLAMYAATLGQNRFGYYLGLCLALLSGRVCAVVLDWAWTPPQPGRSRADERRARAHGPHGTWQPMAWRIGAVAAVVVLVYAPSAVIAYPMAQNNLGLSAGYRASLEWLRGNTPEPFGAGDYYFARYRPGDTPRPAYTVMAWWDYGYEIIRLGRRVPVANPTQAGADIAGRFFTSQDEAEAVKILDQTNSRYVIAHAEVPILPRGGLVQGKFETLAAWAGKDINQYWETFLTKDAKGGLGPLVLFHPAYYRTMVVRLYVYGGQAALPNDSTYVITYAERRNADIEAVADLEAFDEVLAQIEVDPEIVEVDQRDQRHAR